MTQNFVCRKAQTGCRFLLLPDSDILDNFPIKIAIILSKTGSGSSLGDAHLVHSVRSLCKSSLIMSSALVWFYQIFGSPFELLKDVELHHCRMEP